MEPPTQQQLAAIASACDRRWDRHYTRSKLATDPVYLAVAEVLHPTISPVLDIGCGMGLLAHYLRACGISSPVDGFDFDERKIRSAVSMARRAALKDVHFHCGDAREGLNAFSGSVVILDVLQYLGPEQQRELLLAAAGRVAAGCCLVIRSGLRDDSWRYGVTRLGDWVAKLSLWMKAGPVQYPTAEELRQLLSEQGLAVTVSPLWGGTPFNNHLIVARRA
ncbi:MAG: methyltransferase domain-containing protein [Verrucomicrobiaceae bacterium]|nr:methyltransferase domain-containing protein [Verrucomicrobiaceae bacterium]